MRNKATGEGATVENPALGWFEDIGWEVVDGRQEDLASGDRSGTFGRTSADEVILPNRLRPELERLNPDLPASAIDQAVSTLLQRRTTLSLVRANEEMHKRVTRGVDVTVRRDGEEIIERVRVIDWDAPEANDFLVVQQLHVTGDPTPQYPDLVGFVNGIPLVLFELKSQRNPVRSAYTDNLARYRRTIPHLLAPNALVILSNRTDTRVGSTTAPWEHFAGWKKVEGENESPRVSLRRTIEAVCDKHRLLDLVQHFIVHTTEDGQRVKILAKYHQFHGVNNAFAALEGREDAANRLGVFWHTQGSGKSLSMVFFAQKVLRQLPGNWTFVIVTDRRDLDNQIYKTFARAGIVTESESQVRANSRRDLRRMLQEDHRFVFTLIQKFDEGGEESDRNDIIVMTDEAHRSQYDTYAGNMRAALPNAAFLGFTGTPLKADQELTRQEFGDYVSVYDFADAINDGATVPLYYENRIPQLQLTNEALNEDMAALLDEMALDAAEEREIERMFSSQYVLITRDDRLDKVGEDIAEHFMGRGYRGKAMVISIDKPTAVRTYDKVQYHWQKQVDALKKERTTVSDGTPRARQIDTDIAYMEETDMAVVVSESADEIERAEEHGADIQPHRERMNREDLDEKFKDADDPLRIVFVCAKWITGFDVKPCSTMYLDKPMRNHTLMQAVARANRVFEDKPAGIIVDYIGVFSNIQEALALYTRDGDETDGTVPIKPKEDLIRYLEEAITDARAFCQEHGVDLTALQNAGGDDHGDLVESATDALLVRDEVREQFLAHARRVERLYRAILPDPGAQQYSRLRYELQYLVDALRAVEERPDVRDAMRQIDELLDESVAAEPYLIRDPRTVEYDTEVDVPRDDAGRVNLSDLDADALRERFDTGASNLEAERLRRLLAARIGRLADLNPERMDYQRRLETLIERYNEGSYNQEEYFQMLLALMEDLQDEEQRAVREGLSEEELAMFDILMSTPAPDLTGAERAHVKSGAKDLVETLKAEKLVLDWRQKQPARSTVRIAIEKVLDEFLPSTFSKDVYDAKVNAVYQHVYDKYYGPNGDNFYDMAA